MKQLLLLLAIFITTTVAFAQREQISVKQPGKKPFVIYENKQAVISFEKEAFTNAFNGLNKTATDDQLFNAAVNRYNKTGNAIQVKEVIDASSTDEQRFFTTLIQHRIGGQLLINGNAAIYNLKSKKNAAVIEYENDTFKFNYFFPGYTSAFFQFEIPIQKGSAYSRESEVPAHGDNYAPVFAEPLEEQTVDENKTYTVVEQQPEYPGGVEKLMEYLKANLKRSDECDGSVYISFVVDKDGRLADFQVLKSLAPACDEEALRVVKGMNKWIPGKEKGEVVRVRFVLPVKFRDH